MKLLTLLLTFFLVAIGESTQVQDLVFENNTRLKSILLDDGTTIDTEMPLTQRPFSIQPRRKDTKEVIMVALTDLNQWQVGDNVSIVEVEPLAHLFNAPVLFNERSKVGVSIYKQHDTDWIIDSLNGNVLVIESVNHPGERNLWLIPKVQLEKANEWNVGDFILYKQRLTLEHSLTSETIEIFDPNSFTALYESEKLKKFYLKIEEIFQTDTAVLARLDNGTTWKLELEQLNDWQVGDQVILEQTPSNLENTIPYALINLRSLKLAPSSLYEVNAAESVSGMEQFKFYNDSKDEYMCLFVGDEVWLCNTKDFSKAKLQPGSFVMMTIDDQFHYSILNLSELLTSPNIQHAHIYYGCSLKDYPHGLRIR